MSTDFVPEGFTPPDGLIAEAFVLEPLGPEHNEADHAAWMSSIEHIHASPGFADDSADDSDPWPRPMTLEQNLSDLEQQRADPPKEPSGPEHPVVACGSEANDHVAFLEPGTRPRGLVDLQLFRRTSDR